VALITEHRGFTFEAPWAFRKDCSTNCAPTILRAEPSWIAALLDIVLQIFKKVEKKST
jgi:hypothetical protein